MINKITFFISLDVSCFLISSKLNTPFLSNFFKYFISLWICFLSFLCIILFFLGFSSFFYISLSLSPCDFFLWGYMKGLVYVSFFLLITDLMCAMSQGVHILKTYEISPRINLLCSTPILFNFIEQDLIVYKIIAFKMMSNFFEYPVHTHTHTYIYIYILGVPKNLTHTHIYIYILFSLIKLESGIIKSGQ